MVVSIRYIDIAAVVYGHTFRRVKLSVAIASAAPLDHKDTVAIKLLDAMVACIRYIDIVAAVHGHTVGVLELAVATTPTTPLVRKTPLLSNFWMR